MSKDEVRPSMQRCFLGWDRPILHAAVSYLFHRYSVGSEWNLDNVLVVLPSSLAGRRLGECLAEFASQKGLLLRPPEIVTVGKLPEKLYQARLPFADDAVQVLCWAKVLRESPPEELQPLLLSVPTSEDVKPWIDLGSMLAGLHRELATDLMLFGDVADRLKGNPEEARWRVLARVQRKYLDLLHQENLWDIQTARRVAINHREPATQADILVLGAVDLNRAQRRFLDAVRDKVTILVGAPESWSEGFDAYGALQQDFWQDLQVTLDPSTLHVRGTAVDAATEVVRQLASLPAGVPTEQITIGVPDDELIPIVAEKLHHSDVVGRYGPGSPVNQSPPVKLLRAICTYLDEGTFHAFAALLRMPAVSAMLRRLHGLPIDYLQQVDRYYEATLLRSVNVAKWPESPYLECVSQVVGGIDEWLQPLRSPKQRLCNWSKPLLSVMQTCYGPTTVDLDQSVDACLWDACSQVTDGIARLADIPDSVQIEIALTEAVAWVQRFLDKARVPPPQDPSAVELLGWLELALDDAEVLILSGLHDGTVPESVNADPFLPNELRRELGLMDNARRYARDCYTLQAILHARKHVSIVVHQQSVQGDPLTPSRLLLAVPSSELAARVEYLLDPPSGQPPPLKKRWTPRIGQSDLPIPKPTKLIPPSSLAVTDFRIYLECPYRFYLRKIERLYEVDDADTELQANQFGNLIHDCLASLHPSPVETSRDSEAIADFLDDKLDALVETRYGVHLRPAVQLQVEQAKQRLRAFAVVQAARAQEGWTIFATEHSFEQEHPIAISFEGRTMLVHGRVDRIDYHPRLRKWAVWDYKTSDTPKNPVKAHYTRGRGWTDFQLLLYREMIRSISEVQPTDAVMVGYIQLPKNASQTKFEEAEFAAEQLETGMRSALDAFDAIQKGLFWGPEKEHIPPWDPFFAICQTDIARPWMEPKEDSVTAPTNGSHSECPSQHSVVHAIESESAKSDVSAPQEQPLCPVPTQKRLRDQAPVPLRLKAVPASGQSPSDWFDAELIRASAGTGKTYRLAVRMLRLLFSDQPLDHVLATTFTRKAAGEILHRVLRKLAGSINDDAQWKQLRQDLAGLEVRREHCEYQLARLCTSLHRFRVSTLDAFYSQLAKSFSLELELPPGWHLASEFDERRLRDEAIDRLFENYDRTALRTLLGLLFKGESGQSIQSQIREVVNNGYRWFRVTQETAWTAFPIPLAPSDAEWKHALFVIEHCSMTQKNLASARKKLLEQVAEGDWASLIESTLVVNTWEETPSYGRTELPSELVDAIQVVAKYAASQEIAIRRAQTEASFALLQKYHEQLEIVKHQARIVSFDDISLKLARWMASKLSAAKKKEQANFQSSIDFRLDARIDHLLLDEFQDTSPPQWEIIRPFAEAIARENIRRDRSFFCVGDTKQAIYGWRGGVAEIFDSVQDHLPGVQESGLNKSHRSSPVVINFVNHVFGNLDRHPNFGEGENASSVWQQAFPPHATAKEGLPGYIQLVNGPPQRDSRSEEHADEEETEEGLMRKAVDDLAALAQSAPSISIGVLVRRNRDVAKMIHLLRMKSVDASQEGGNPLTDSAAVELLLSLLQIADHPAHRIAAYHVVHSPLAARLGFKPMIETDRLAESIRKRVVDVGYGPTVAHFADQMAEHCNERDQQRLEQLVQLAYQYDPRSTPRIRDFIDFIRTEKVALPTPSQVRVMTIHQSKGLEFDAVFLPDLDLQIKGRPPAFVLRTPDRTAAPTGVIRYFNKALRPYISEEWQQIFVEVSEHQLTEALCVFYVALTRARQALYLYTTAHSKPANRWGSVLQSILVSNPSERGESDRLLYRQGDEEWYRSAAQQDLPQVEHDVETVQSIETIEPPQLSVQLHRITPQESTRHRPSRKPSAAAEKRLVSLKQALEPSGSVGAIIGTLVHRWFEEIGWIDDFRWDRSQMKDLAMRTLLPEQMPLIRLDDCLDDMERMLEMKSVRVGLSRARYELWKKQGVDTIEVSNERKLLEIFDGCLLRGTIDRLVLGVRHGVVMRAEILDYKTDAIDDSGSLESWERERVEHHAPQLEQYREVLCQQFHLKRNHVQLSLLLLSADSLCELPLSAEDIQIGHRKHGKPTRKLDHTTNSTAKQMTLDFFQE